MAEGGFNLLPSEILHTIALMLPFSSIIQLRRSCSCWYKALKDPQFIDLQLTRELSNTGFLFTPICRLPQIDWKCYFAEQSGDHMSTSKIFDCSGSSYYQSSGGLISAYSSYCYRIFNPYTGEEVRVPDRDSTSKTLRHCYWFFSYSSSTKEYKILTVGLSTKWGVAGAIYTLGSNTWRELQNVPVEAYERSRVECKDTLFWFTDSLLCSFDLISEEFHVCPGPPRDLVSEKLYENRRYEFIWTGIVSMGHTIGYVKYFKLWVLEDKIKGIWSKKYDILIPSLYKGVRFSGSLENGKMFGYFTEPDTGFFCYDKERTEFSIMDIKSSDDFSWCNQALIMGAIFCRHVKSVVSPLGIMKMGLRNRNLESTENANCSPANTANN